MSEIGPVRAEELPGHTHKHCNLNIRLNFTSFFELNYMLAKYYSVNVTLNS